GVFISFAIRSSLGLNTFLVIFFHGMSIFRVEISETVFDHLIHKFSLISTLVHDESSAGRSTLEVITRPIRLTNDNCFLRDQQLL
ncbi:hypothetical protein PFISCL1PPCAC_27065, partial [Pristionchus fissidentatus]